MATLQLRPAQQATEQPTATEPLQLIRDAGQYRQLGCNTFPYTGTHSDDQEGKPGKAQWLEMYRNTIAGFQRQAADDQTVLYPEKAAARFAEQYGQILDDFAGDAAAGPEQLNTVKLCRLREERLRQQGFGDVYRSVKFQENVKALGLLTDILRELDETKDFHSRLDSALRGAFAGNIFDLGAPATTAAFASGQMSFAKARQDLVSRPWARDDLDAVIQRWQQQPHRRALIFVDNSGSDIVLGMLPLARELIKMGTTVILAANEVPSINDITIQELQPLLQQAAQLDSVLSAALSIGRLQAVSSGNDLPVIDLSRVPPELNAIAQGVDLIVLEGMGRGIETNLNADFTCDALNLGMVKHPEVAAALGVRMYDIVCQYKPAIISG